MVFIRHQLEPRRERLEARIEGGICDAPEDPPATIPVMRPPQSTGGLRPEVVVGIFQVDRLVHSVPVVRNEGHRVGRLPDQNHRLRLIVDNTYNSLIIKA